MKKYKISGIFLFLFISFLSCEEVKDPAGERNAGGVPTITDLDPGIFDSNDLVNSFVEFNLNLQDGMPAQKAEVEASYNGGDKVKIAEFTTFPANMRFVSGNVISQLGLNQADIENGDLFTFEIALTDDAGRVTHSNTVLNVRVACAFDESLATGSFRAVSESWVVDGNISIDIDPAHPYQVLVTGLETIDGNVEDLGPLVLKINPIDFSVSLTKTVLVSAVSWGPYHNLAYAGSGQFDSCTGTYQMNFDITVDEGNFGRFAFTITKNP